MRALSGLPVPPVQMPKAIPLGTAVTLLTPWLVTGTDTVSGGVSQRRRECLRGNAQK